MDWRIAYSSSEVQDAILNLPAGLQARYIHLTERMQRFGSNLGMPHTRAMGGGLFEIRMKSAEGIARVMYCTVRERRIIMLHTFVKKSAKTPSRDLAIARTRMKEVFQHDET